MHFSEWNPSDLKLLYPPHVPPVPTPSRSVPQYLHIRMRSTHPESLRGHRVPRWPFALHIPKHDGSVPARDWLVLRMGRTWTCKALTTIFGPCIPYIFGTKLNAWRWFTSKLHNRLIPFLLNAGRMRAVQVHLIRVVRFQSLLAQTHGLCFADTRSV